MALVVVRQEHHVLVIDSVVFNTWIKYEIFMALIPQRLMIRFSLILIAVTLIGCVGGYGNGYRNQGAHYARQSYGYAAKATATTNLPTPTIIRISPLLQPSTS